MKGEEEMPNSSTLMNLIVEPSVYREQRRRRRGGTDEDMPYPSVLMKPLVEPSAYREQMSPM